MNTPNNKRYRDMTENGAALTGYTVSYIMSTEQSKKPCGARHSGPFVV